MTGWAAECFKSAPTHPTRRALAIGVIALGFTARILTAFIGDNFDMESWWLASEATRQGEHVYAFTHRYNYGPLWAWIIWAARSIASSFGSDSITTLHLLLTAILSFVDLALSGILYRTVSARVALLFFLNPISIAVTGYHIQFDNFAILLALIAWGAFLNARSWTTLLMASLLFGASLSLKHVFILFIGWLPFLTSIRSLRERLILAAIGLVVFFGSFTPWINTPAAWQGIRANVFGYVSTEGHSLTSLLADILAGVAPRTVFMTLTMATGYLLAMKPRLHAHAPFLYLIALVALSSGMARNYLAVPLVGLFALPWSVFSSLYIAISTLALVTVHSALGVSEVAAWLFSTELITYELAQCALVGVLLNVWRRSALPTEQFQRSESPQTP